MYLLENFHAVSIEFASYESNGIEKKPFTFRS